MKSDPNTSAIVDNRRFENTFRRILVDNQLSIDLHSALGLVSRVLQYPTTEAELAPVGLPVEQSLQSYLDLTVGEVESRSNTVTFLAGKFEAFLRKLLYLQDGTSDWSSENVWSALGKPGMFLVEKANAFLEIDLKTPRPDPWDWDYVFSSVRSLRNRFAHSGLLLPLSRLDEFFETVAVAYLKVAADSLERGIEISDPRLAPAAEYGHVLARYYRPLGAALQRHYYAETDLVERTSPEVTIEMRSNSINDDDQPQLVSGIRLLQGERSNLVLLGPGGSGKSTLLQEFLRSEINLWENSERGFRLPPVLIRLAGAGVDILTSLADSLSCDPAMAKSMLIAGICILADGLDEVSSLHRNDTLRALSKLSETYTQSRVILTSRPSTIARSIRWPTYEVLPLSLEQAREICRFGLSEEDTETLLSTKSAWVDHLFGSPFLVKMLADMYGAEHRLPSDLFDLYSFVTMRAAEREFSRGSGHVPDEALRTLERLAILMTSNECTVLTLAEAEQIGVQYEKLPLLVSHRDAVSFVHKSFQDFFASKGMIASHQPLLDPGQPQWVDCIVFLRLVPSQAQPIVDKLVQQGRFAPAIIVMTLASGELSSTWSNLHLDSFIKFCPNPDLPTVVEELCKWEAGVTATEWIVEILFTRLVEDRLPGFDELGAVARVLQRSELRVQICDNLLNRSQPLSASLRRDCWALAGRIDPERFLGVFAAGPSEIRAMAQKYAPEVKRGDLLIYTAIVTGLNHVGLVSADRFAVSRLFCQIQAILAKEEDWTRLGPGDGKGFTRVLSTAIQILARLDLPDTGYELMKLVEQEEICGIARKTLMTQTLITGISHRRPEGWKQALEKLRSLGTTAERTAASKALGWHCFETYFEIFKADMRSKDEVKARTAISGLRASKHPKALALLEEAGLSASPNKPAEKPSKPLSPREKPGASDPYPRLGEEVRIRIGAFRGQIGIVKSIRPNCGKFDVACGKVQVRLSLTDVEWPVQG